MAEAKWYVVHTYSGHENKVKANIQKIVENRGMEDIIFDVAIPTENIVEERKGKKYVKPRKIFPGYVIVKMIMTDTSWYVIRNTRGVTGFIGPVGSTSRPVALTDEEVEVMGLEKENDDIVKPQLNVEVGDAVRIISGVYKDIETKILEVYPDLNSVKVSIKMSGKEQSPVIAYNEIEKIE